MFDGIPCMGKKLKLEGLLPIAEFFVQGIHNSNRSVTTDNWFTGIKQANGL